MQADVLVVGGGYTGLSAALHLAEKGVLVVLLETLHRGKWSKLRAAYYDYGTLALEFMGSRG
jgi:glycine/D-amino acid oxidase-like deaminating enzyme